MGTPQAAVPSLERCIIDGHEVVAVYTQPDRPSGRGNKIKTLPVKVYTVANELPLHQPLKIKSPESIDIFRSHNADVAVVVAFGRILPDSYLSAFQHGAINVHFSLLPKYRGAAPVNWAIVNGELETGVTTMQMDAGLDTGDILLQRSTPIGERETSVELMARLSDLGADLLSETLGGLDEIVPKPQEPDLATLAPIMKREDGLIDWRMTAADISNRVRGFQPFPAAFTTFRGGKLILWDTSAYNESGRDARATGEIVTADAGGLFVSCDGGSVLQIDELQPEGKRRMTVKDFMNGAQPQAGEVLGK